MFHQFLSRLLFGTENTVSGKYPVSQKHKTLRLESLEDRHLLSVSFDPGAEYTYAGTSGTAIAPVLGVNRGVYIADFTNDQNADILAVNVGKTTVYTNQNGNFSGLGTDTYLDELSQSHATAVGKLNTDGYADLVNMMCNQRWNGTNWEPTVTVTTWNGSGLANSSASSAVWSTQEYNVAQLFGLGDATFTLQVSDLQILDANGDGNNDLVGVIQYQTGTSSSSSQRVVLVLTGLGNGSFSSTPYLVSGLSASASGEVQKCADLAGTSAMEVVTLSSDGRSIDIYGVTANGTGASKLATYTYGSPISRIFTGDVNGDGKSELLIYSTSGGKSYLEAVRVTQSGSSCTFTPLGDKTEVTTSVTYLATGDLNKDGKPDILISDGVTYQVLIQGNDSSFTAQNKIVTLADYVTSVTGDFDGDGINDVLAVGKNIATLIPGGAAKTPSVVINFSEQGIAPRDFAFGDFNHDGSIDIAVLGGNLGEEIVLFNGTPSGTSKFVKSSTVLSVTFGQKLLAGNFDNTHEGDDLAVIYGTENTNSSISTFVSTASGLSASPVSSTLNFGYLDDFTAGKFSSTTVDDIAAIRKSSSEVCVLKNNGSGRFTLATHVVVGSTAAPLPLDLAIGDVDKDGRNDIVVLLAGEKSLQVLKQNQQGRLELQTPKLISNNLRSDHCKTLQLADFDGDGSLDAFVGVIDGTSRGSFLVIQNDSAGNFNSISSMEVPAAFGSTMYGRLGLSIGYMDDNDSPDVILVGDNTVMTFKNKALFKSESGEIQLVFRDYSSAKSTSQVGNLATLGNQRTYLDEWSCFQVEVWANTKSVSEGISEFSCVIRFDAAVFEVDNVSGSWVFEGGSGFTNVTCVVANGTVTLTGRLANGAAVQGAGTNTLLGRIAFIPAENGTGVPINIDGQYLTPHENGFSVTAGSSTWLKTSAGSTASPKTVANDTPLFAVPYDLNDDNVVNLVDYLYFITVFINPVDQNLFFVTDFDHNNRVEVFDWTYMVTNFIQQSRRQVCRETKSSVPYPANFPADWLPPQAQAAALPTSLANADSGAWNSKANTDSSAADSGTWDNNKVDNASEETFTDARDAQEQALMAYLDAPSQRSEKSFFEELLEEQNDVDSLLKEGAL
ncbi:MAG: VCBS repeat-containing protein [Planctomycetaceae bacterium]|jgi:hypothetical protein|nr:VCBS repeat-containing protein [Planctomycetaceae bacterium]